jgi:hypothetical protein
MVVAAAGSAVSTTLYGLSENEAVQVLRAAAVGSWWHDNVWGTLEPVEFLRCLGAEITIVSVDRLGMVDPDESKRPGIIGSILIKKSYPGTDPRKCLIFAPVSDVRKSDSALASA